MHISIFLVLLAEAILVVNGATINWTLHKSCYRNGDDTADDPQRAQMIIDAVNNAKVWARRSESKISESINPILGPISGRDTRSALAPLLGTDRDYAENARTVIERFKGFADIEGPVGKDGDTRGRYDESSAWLNVFFRYRSSRDHYKNFVIVCKPDFSMQGGKVYDHVRETTYSSPHPFERFMQDATQYNDWTGVIGTKIQAITEIDTKEGRDTDGRPPGVRASVPETINFHPLLVKWHQESGIGRWNPAMFGTITSPTAEQDFRRISREKGLTIRPVDKILDASFERSMIHELFHTTNFGLMIDRPDGTKYGWYNNVDVFSQDLENPDLYALIATVLELRYGEGDKFAVDRGGVVSRL
ncbi:Hypothetical protein D9617_2g059020 [Elsinoe fawcettii]|nr:Hypothetical protein D9617_2g059020 [Elsinoe fawcettii]